MVIVCFVLAAVVMGQAVRIFQLKRSADEIGRGFGFRLLHDTNTLITLSCRDRHMCRLANQINRELKLLRRQRQRFYQGDLEVKESITSLSHDLRTPLTAICGYLDLTRQEIAALKEEKDLMPEKEEQIRRIERYLKVIEERTENLKLLTEELFGYTLASGGGREPVYEEVVLNHMLEESISAYYGAIIGRGIEPDIIMPEGQVRRRLDRKLLLRILENVLYNAIKYSDGDLSIRLSEEGEIIVSNHAAKLSEVQLQHLFNRFYTVEDAQSSTGLGLSIARTLTKQMHGEITAQYQEQILSIRISFPENKLYLFR